MNMYIVEIKGRKFVAASTSAENAVNFIAEREGYTDGEATVKTISFGSTWYFEANEFTIITNGIKMEVK